MNPISAANPATHRAPSRVRLLWAGVTALALVLLSSVALGAEAPVAPSAAYRLPEDPAELLRLDDAMHRFFAARVPRSASTETKLDAIVAAILGEEGLHFRYEYTGLYDVREAFRRRRGNCVTFSLLVVAIAREFRIPAAFNEVGIFDRWDRLGCLVVERRHINVWVPAGSEGYEIDLKMFAEARSARNDRCVVSDARAAAALYSNAGVFRLAEGDRAAALRLLERATAVDPSAPSAWANLATLHLVAGDNAAARAGFGRALALAPSSLSATSGLAYLERSEGRMDEAARLERRARRYREHNPYFFCGMARTALEDGRVEDARRHLLRAVRLKDDEPEFYLLMADVARRLGHEREARRWANRWARLGREVALVP